MEIATPYDGIPRNPVKRAAKRVLEPAIQMLRAAPGYDRVVQAVDAVTGADAVGWQRKIMYEETKRLFEQLGPSELAALEISGLRWGSLCKFKSYKSVDFPEYDLCAAPLPEQFDLVI